MSAAVELPPRVSGMQEARKLLAFLRRDFLIAWSYRLAFFSDWVNLFVQIALFYFVGRLVDPRKMPTFHGSHASYIEFVAVGIAITSFMQVGIGRVVTAMRNEQLMGTLESLLMTPTSPVTVQLGSVVYEVVYVPIRTLGFLFLASAILGAHFDFAGVGPALVVLLLFVPLVWGLGMVSAAGVVTFRRGLGIVGVGTLVLTATSSTYFPVGVFPSWFRGIARLNPVSITLQAARNALLGGAGWRSALPAAFILAPMAVAALALGMAAFGRALRRERRRGTLGLY
jgi:ABC-type multidrug transport system permease subunit